MTTTPPAGYGDPTCPHVERSEGICVRCGHCQHDVLLNGACFLCGTTNLDPPKPRTVVPVDALVRKKP